MKCSLEQLQSLFIHTLEKHYTNKAITRQQLDVCTLIIQLIEANFILIKPIQTDISKLSNAYHNTDKEDEIEIEVEVYLQVLVNEIKNQLADGKPKSLLEPLIRIVAYYKRRWIDGEIA